MEKMKLSDINLKEYEGTGKCFGEEPYIYCFCCKNLEENNNGGYEYPEWGYDCCFSHDMQWLDITIKEADEILENECNKAKAKWNSLTEIGKKRKILDWERRWGN